MHDHVFSYARCLLVVGLLVTLVGCGGKDLDPDFKPVSGTVKLDGKPLTDAQVSFIPVAGGNSGSGTTDENGVYTLYYAAQRPGAKLGENRVSISKENPDVADGIDEGVEISEEESELLPACYNRDTELAVTVEDKENVFDFELTSDGK